MSQLTYQQTTKLDARAVLLSMITLLLTFPLLKNLDNPWLANPAGMMVILATVCLFAGLFATLLQLDRVTHWLLIAAVLSLTAVLLWKWQLVLTILIELRLGILSIFAVTILGYFIHARLRSQGPIKLRSTLLLSALPVILVCGVYLLLASSGGLAAESIDTLISIGLAITYFNLGATVFGGGPPLDGGRLLPDGVRLLGNGKTWRGSIGGVLLATLAFTVFTGSPGTGFLVAMIAFYGDAAASFLKRRLGQEQSKTVPLLDQWDNLLPLLYCAAWGKTPIALPPGSVLILLMGTLFIQFLGNRILFILGKKKVPW